MTAVADPIDIVAFQDAIHAWFVGATGLFTVWRKQGTPQPEFPFGTLMLISGPTATSARWEVRRTFSQTRPPGQEFKFEYGSPCRAVVSCQAYSAADDVASKYLNRAIAAYQHGVYQTILSTAGIAVERFSTIRNIGSVINETEISRYNLDITFAATMLTTEYAGYVDSLEMSSESLHMDIVIP